MEMNELKIVLASKPGIGLRWVFTEQRPLVLSTKWHLGRHSDRVLSLPRMLFLVLFYRGGYEACFAFFLRRPYTGSSTELYHTILPNQWDNGRVCIGGNDQRDELIRATGLRGSDRSKVAVVLDWYWNKTHFGDHYIERLHRAAVLHRDLRSLASWERASRLRPKFIEHVPWLRFGQLHRLSRPKRSR